MQVVLGKRSTRPAVLDSELAKELLACQESNGVNTILGTTMCTDDFYEGECYHFKGGRSVHHHFILVSLYSCSKFNFDMIEVVHTSQ